MRNTAASIKDRLLNIAKQEGLLLFQLQGMVARPTKDIDLLGPSDRKEEALLQDLLDSASAVMFDDGLTFDRSSIEVAPIAGQTENGGIRGHIVAYLGSARTRIQIDMGFGDVITGGPVERPYRTLLGNRSFSIQTYSDETMVAEKIDAVVSLGIINSRYKDLYDLFTLLVDTGVPEGAVIEATSNTFLRRKTSLPAEPESLSPRHRID